VTAAISTRLSLRGQPPTLGQLWAFLAVGLPALAALLVPMPAVDLAYQLRAGADILAGHGIPTADTWTFTVFGAPWLDQQWGAQALLALVYQWTGWTGLALLRAGLVGLTFALVRRAVRSAWSIASIRAGGSAVASSSRTATLVTLLAFIVAAPGLALRPQLFAIALFAATLVIVVERAAHPRRLWLVPVIAAVWANLHGSFPLVIVLVGLAWLDEVVLLREALPAGTPPRRLRARLLGSTGLAIIGAAATLATLVTPFGIDAWRYIENLARNPEITSQVSEWRPPSPLDPAGAIFYASVLIVLGMVAFRLRMDRRRPPARFVGPLVTVAVFAILGAVTGRGLAWWALAAPVAMVALQPGLKLSDAAAVGLPRVRARTAREAAESENRASPLNAVVMVVLVIAGVALLPLWRPLGPAGVPIATLSSAPQGIAAVLTARIGNDGTGRPAQRKLTIWAPQAWGSWLEWAVPDACYAVDSRIELFPPKLWSDYAELASATGEWASVLPRSGGSILVIAADQRALLAAVQAAPSWTRLYADVDGSVWSYQLNDLGVGAVVPPPGETCRPSQIGG
jgi:hypothetical protein